MSFKYVVVSSLFYLSTVNWLRVFGKLQCYEKRLLAAIGETSALHTEGNSVVTSSISTPLCSCVRVELEKKTSISCQLWSFEEEHSVSS